MTVFEDNAAGRLHGVLKALKAVTPGSVSVRDAWAQVLAPGDLPRNTNILVRRITEVFQLPTTVELEMQQIDDENFDREFSMRWLKPVEITFGETLFSNAQVVQTLHYDELALASLENCSYLLHRYRREPVPTDADLESVRRLISELEEMIAVDGEIDSRLRDFLLRHARAMRIAVDDFKIVGVQAINEAIDQAVGASIREGYVPDASSSEHAQDSTGKRAAVAKFWEMLTRAALVISLSANILTLGQAAHSELTAGSHVPSAIENVVNVDEPPNSGSITLEVGPHDPQSAGSPATSNGR